MNINPKISFVIAARNDDYGGHFFERISTFVKSLIYLTNKHQSPFELIIVEYNPPLDKPFLTEVLPIKNNKYLSVRFIAVPNEFHQEVAKGSKNPFLEYLAKNIGIRRAKGEYILATNPDIIFSDQFIKFLADGRLEKNKFYRINRHDLPAHIFDENMTVSEILYWCQNHVIRIMTNNGTLFISYKRWLKRFAKRPSAGHLLRLPIFNFIPKLKGKLRPNRIHEAAGGDFMMTHSNTWKTVKGYDQIPFNSLMDGYNLHMFLCHGFEQKILPFPIYHIGHKTSNDTRKQPDLKTYLEITSQMKKTKIPYKEYSPDWGFPQISFEEHPFPSLSI